MSKKEEVVMDDRVERLGKLIEDVVSANRKAHDIMKSLYAEWGPPPRKGPGGRVIIDKVDIRGLDTQMQPWGTSWSNAISEASRLGTKASEAKWRWKTGVYGYMRTRLHRAEILSKLTEEERFVLAISNEMIHNETNSNKAK